MLRELENRLKERGIDHTYLLTRKGGPAEKFYAENGYRTSERMALMSRRF